MDVIGAGLGVIVVSAMLAFVVVAFVQVQLDGHLDGVSHLVWSLAVLVAPFVGACAWYLLRARGTTTWREVASDSRVPH